MNSKEQELYNEILHRYEGQIDRSLYNAFYLTKIAKVAGKDRLYLTLKSTYNILDYLDGRKNMLEIPKYDSHTGEKVNKANIKKELIKIDVDEKIKLMIYKWEQHLINN